MLDIYTKLETRGPLVLYHSPASWGYAEFEQAWKYTTLCGINLLQCRSIRTQIWPCHKNGQGQPSVIIWTNFSPYMVLEAILVMWSGTFQHSFTPHPMKAPYKNCFKRPHIFWGKEVLKCWIWVTLDKGQWMTLTLGCHKSSCTHVSEYIFEHIFTIYGHGGHLGHVT